MLILKLVRFIFGYVEFCACGGFPERFLNLCRLRGIALWNVTSDGKILRGFADISSYKKMRNIAKSSGMKMCLEAKHGLSFFLNRHSARVGVIAGMCITAAVISILSTRLWSINVTGNCRIPSEEIISAFEKVGVKKGVSAAKIKPTEAELEVINLLDGVSWVNVNIRGCSALIEVRETVESEDNSGSGMPSDIVAAADGILVILRPFSGTAEEKAGNAVIKGDLLISGIKQNRDLSESLCEAQGYAIARTDKKLSSAAKRSFKAAKTADIKNSYIIEFFGLKIPLGKPKSKNPFILKSDIEINGVTLPISLTRIIDFSYKETNISLSESRCALLAFSEYCSGCDENLKYVKAEKLEAKGEKFSDGCRITGKAVCLENIGKSVPIDIDRSESPELSDIPQSRDR